MRSLSIAPAAVVEAHVRLISGLIAARKTVISAGGKLLANAAHTAARYIPSPSVMLLASEKICGWRARQHSARMQRAGVTMPRPCGALELELPGFLTFDSGQRELARAPRLKVAYR